MQFKLFKTILAAGILFAVWGTGPVFGQADSKALTEMLVKKGILSNQEAADLAAKFNKADKSYTKIKVASWLDELKIYGDVRVRWDDLFARRIASTPASGATGTSDEQDRQRFRYRLRTGMTAKAGEWQAGFRLTSNDTAAPGDPISGNATETGYFSKKAINIDLAFLQYDPKYAEGLTLMAGKFDNPFWESDMVFDPDITTEGFAEKYHYNLNDNFSFFVNTSQFVLAENNVASGVPAAAADSAIRGKDEYLFGFQGGAKMGFVPKKVELTSAVGFYDYEGLENIALGANVNGGDSMNNFLGFNFGNLVPQATFKVLAFNNELRLDYLEKLPIRAQFEYINNIGNNFLGAGGGVQANEGFKGGFILGDAKKKGDWQVGGWYEYLGANANFSIFSDSDFGTGGTNEQGFILKAYYNLTDYMVLGFAYFNATSILDSLPSLGSNALGATGAGGPTSGVGGGSYGASQRIFVDLMMKF